MAAVHKKIYEENLRRSMNLFHTVPYYVIEIVAYSAVFWVGYKKQTPLMLIPPFIILVLKDQLEVWRERRMFDDMSKTLKDTKTELVLKDTSRLPAWVHYPDVERSTWVNKLLGELWPHLDKLVPDLIDSQVKPALNKEVPGFKIKKISLGTIPPFINGIKVYDRSVTSRELILDVNYSYPGDCEFDVAFMKIPGGVRNVQVSGKARIYLKLLDEKPFVGGLEVSLLGDPDIDFLLTGVGSLGPTEELMDYVLQRLASTFVIYPRKVSIAWEKHAVDEIMDSKGVIRVNVIEAKLTCDYDSWRGSESRVEIEHGHLEFKSPEIRNSDTPDWNYWCEFLPSTKQDDTVVISVIYKEDNDSMKKIGHHTMKIDEIVKSGKVDSWYDLEGHLPGSVHINATFHPLTSDIKKLRLPPPELAFLSTYILFVFVRSAYNLEMPRSLHRPNSLVVVTVGKHTETTKAIHSDNPNFDKGFFFPVENPEFFKLNLKVIDKEKKVELGHVDFSLWKLLHIKNMELMDEHFPLINSVSDSSINLSLRLRIVDNYDFE